MISPLSFSAMTPKPLTPAIQAQPPQFGNGDRFVHSNPSPAENPEHETEAQIRALSKRAIEDHDLGAIMMAVELLDDLCWQALDNSDCDRARDYLRRREELDAQYTPHPDNPPSPYRTEEELRERVRAVREQMRIDAAAETDLSWAEDMVGLPIEDAGLSLHDEREELGTRLAQLRMNIEQLLAIGTDESDMEAVMLNEQRGRLQAERDALGYDD